MIQYFEQLLKTIDGSIHSLDSATFERLTEEAVETLRRGGKVVASGLGKNVPVCEKFVGTMNSLGQEAYYMNTNSAVHGDIGIVKEGDLVIVLQGLAMTIVDRLGVTLPDFKKNHPGGHIGVQLKDV